MTPVSRRRRSAPIPKLPDRSRAILSAVVRSYIERGEPVSSLWLTRHGRFGVSSATLRNTMAELEQLGYVCQPHTSSGRVPTDIGYRCYVDLLLEGRRPARSPRTVEAAASGLHGGGSAEHRLARALTRVTPSRVRPGTVERCRRVPPHRLCRARSAAGHGGGRLGHRACLSQGRGRRRRPCGPSISLRPPTI